MKKFILDFEFNEVTGNSRIVVDFNDDSMTQVEINESIRSGELLDEVVKQAAGLFGDNVAQQIRNGSLSAICLDNHPELKTSEGGILINNGQTSRQEIKQ